jgi:hypothetical protein
VEHWEKRKLKIYVVNYLYNVYFYIQVYNPRDNAGNYE